MIVTQVGEGIVRPKSYIPTYMSVTSYYLGPHIKCVYQSFIYFNRVMKRIPSSCQCYRQRSLSCSYATGLDTRARPALRGRKRKRA